MICKKRKYIASLKNKQFAARYRGCVRRTFATIEERDFAQYLAGANLVESDLLVFVGWARDFDDPRQDGHHALSSRSKGENRFSRLIRAPVRVVRESSTGGVVERLEQDAVL